MNKKIAIGVIMIIIVLITLSPSFIKQMVPENSYVMGTIAQVSQVMTNIFIVFGVIVALWQYIIYSRRELDLKSKEIYDMEKDSIQKAIDLSCYFKDNILEPMAPILHIFTETGIKNIIDKIPIEKMNRFDKLEMQFFLNDKEIKQINDVSKTDKFKRIIIDICMADEKWKACIDQLDVIEDGKPVKNIKLNISTAMFRYASILQNTLNNLEYFSMHFTHKTADESVIYQSIHYAYLDIVEMLYCEMCKNNNGSTERKLYTNIIELFRMWRDEAERQKNDELAAADEHLRLGKRLEKK